VAFYAFHLAGRWRSVYIATSTWRAAPWKAPPSPGGAQMPQPSALRCEAAINFGEAGVLFSTRAGISSAEGGSSDPGPFRGRGYGAKLICSRLARLAKTVRFLAPLIAGGHYHSQSLHTRPVHLRLQRGAPIALRWPAWPRHKRLSFSFVSSLKAA